MNDRTLDRLLATSSPLTDRQVDALPLLQAERDLREAILASAPDSVEPSSAGPTGVDYVPSPPASEPHGRRLVLAGVAAAVAIVAVGVGVATMHRADAPDGIAGTSATTEPTTTGPPTASTVNSPLLLLTAPGWQVDYFDQSAPDEGEMSFIGRRHGAELYWRPLDQHEGYVEDRRHASDIEEPVTILGQEGVLFHYEGTSDYTAFWTEGERSFELRASPFADADAFRRVIDLLEPVTEEAWLAALPASAIVPAAAPAAVEAMLADIPVPATVDPAALGRIDTVQDRYQVIAEVTAQITCGWIDQWVAATEAGDTARADEALEAMAGSRDWSALQEIVDEGDWSEALWEYADAMAGAAPGTTGPRWLSHRGDSIGC